MPTRRTPTGFASAVTDAVTGTVTRRCRRRPLLSAVGGLLAPLSGCVGGGGRASDAPASETESAESESESSDRTVRLFAHRGCAEQYPENTVAAVERSAPHVDAVEIDVQRCGSGELVVFHDDELGRLTDAEGSVSTTDWDALKDLTVLDSEETIPRLSTVLDAVPSETAVNIELKHDGMAEDVLAAAEKVENDVLYSSFSANALRELREAGEDPAVAYIFDSSPDISRSIAEDVGCVAVHPSLELVLGTDFVADAHADGFAVNAWTVADAEAAAKLVEAGVDGLIADRWDVLGG